MTRQDNDDVSSLFKSIGAKNKQFKEFDTENNAAQAQERWPLFKTLDLEKRSPPPQLQSSEKKIWEKTAAAPIKPASKKTAPSLGNQIAKGLRSMVHPAADTTLAQKLAPISAQEAGIAVPAPRLGKVRNAFAIAPAALAHTAPTHTALAKPAPTHTAPAASAASAHTAPRGLFAKTKPEAPAVTPPPSAPRGLFAKAPANAPEAPPPKKSLFGKRSPGTPDKVSSVSEPKQPAANNLSSLFARLEQPEPEPAKGLFGRKRKP